MRKLQEGRYLEEQFLLEGEGSCFCPETMPIGIFLHTKGLFSVFLAGIPDKGYPLHHPKFQIDEDILPYSLEALYEILSGIDRDM